MSDLEKPTAAAAGKVPRGYPRQGLIASIVAAACLGMVGLIQASMEGAAPLQEAPLFPLVRTAVEGFSLLSLRNLVIAGFVVGLFRAAPWFLIGLSTMALFPLCSLAEMLVDPTSHNLLPFEWAIYALASLPGAAGSYLGLAVRSLFGGSAPVGGTAK